MGTTTSPTMTSPVPPTMDKIPPTCHHRRITNQEHGLCHPNSHTISRRQQIWNWRIQQQRLSMVIDNPAIMARETHTKPIRISRILFINLHDYPKTGTRLIHISIRGQLQRTLLDEQGVL